MSVYVIHLNAEEGNESYDAITIVSDLYVELPADERYFSKDPYAKIFADGKLYAKLAPIYFIGFEFGSFTDDDGKTYPALYIDNRTYAKQPLKYNLKRSDLKLKPD